MPDSVKRLTEEVTWKDALEGSHDGLRTLSPKSKWTSWPVGKKASWTCVYIFQKHIHAVVINKTSDFLGEHDNILPSSIKVKLLVVCVCMGERVSVKFIDHQIRGPCSQKRLEKHCQFSRHILNSALKSRYISQKSHIQSVILHRDNFRVIS